MPAYMIAHIDVHDPALFEQYRAAVPNVLAAHGGRYLARGGAVTVMEGPSSNRRLVVIQFPDRAAAEAFYASPAYKPLLEMRLAATTSTLVIADGV